MRHLLVVIAVILGDHATSRAGACGRVLGLTAGTPNAPRNGPFLFEAAHTSDADDRDVAVALPKAQFIVDGQRVAVRVLRMFQGGRMQALLAPAKPLPANRDAVLELGIAAIDDAKLTVHIGDLEDGALPRWTAAPKAVRREIVPSHKGDSSDVWHLATPLAAPGFVIATVATVGHPDHTQQIIVHTDGHRITVGRTGCWSMWSPPTGDIAVSLVAVGPAGSEVAAATSLRVKF